MARQITVRPAPGNGTYRHEIRNHGLTLTSAYYPHEGNSITGTITWRDRATADTHRDQAIASFEKRALTITSEPGQHLRTRRTRIGFLITGYTKTATPHPRHPRLPRLHGHLLRPSHNGIRSLTLDWATYSLHIAHRPTG